MDHGVPLTWTPACVYLIGLSDPVTLDEYRNDDSEPLWSEKCMNWTDFTKKIGLMFEVMFLCQRNADDTTANVLQIM